MTDFKIWLRAEWDRVCGFGLIVAGFVLLVLGYVGVSGSTDPVEALSYLVSGAIGGLFALGVGATLLISADLHDEWRKVDALEAAVNRIAPSGEELTASGRPTSNRRDIDVRTLERENGAGRAVALRRYQAASTPGIIIAGLVLTLGWWKTASETRVLAAVDGAVIASLAVVLIGLTAGASTFAMKRAVQGRKGRAFTALSALVATDHAPAETNTVVHNGAVVVGEGLTEYHRADCPALAGVAHTTMERASAEQSLVACRLCEA